MPETERLDTSAHKAKGLLALKARRQRPSRSKLKKNLSLNQSPSQVSGSQPTVPRTGISTSHQSPSRFLLAH